MPEEKEGIARGPFNFEYVTGDMPLLANDGFETHILNDSGTAESMRVVVYQNTGAGAVVYKDTGTMPVAPAWSGGFSGNFIDPGNYWIRIQVSSENLVPQVLFVRDVAGVFQPLNIYRPG